MKKIIDTEQLQTIMDFVNMPKDAAERFKGIINSLPPLIGNSKPPENYLNDAGWVDWKENNKSFKQIAIDAIKLAIADNPKV